MNRFVKKNIILLLVLCSTAVLVVFLLVLAVIQHTRMDQYMKKTEGLRDQIRGLIEQTPAPVKGNEIPLRENAKLYNAAADQLERYFGRPFGPAMDAFIKKLVEGQPRPKDPEEEFDPLTLQKFREYFFTGNSEFTGKSEAPIENFPEGWKGIGEENFAQQQMYYKLFQRKFKNWNEAMQIFRAMASQVTTEPLNDNSVNDLFLSVLGVPRVMNFDPKKLKQYMDDYRLKLLDINGKIIVEAGAMNFSFGDADTTSSPGGDGMSASRFGGTASSRFGGGGMTGNSSAELPAFTKDEYPMIPFHMDVIGDIFSRACQTEIRIVDKIKKRSFTGVEEGSFVRYDYSFEVIGPISEIRKFIHLLEDAYTQNRIYIVRSAFLYQQTDEAAAFVSPGEEVSEDENNMMNNMSPTVNNTGRRARRSARNTGAEMMNDPSMMGGGMYDGMETAQQRMERRRLAEIEREKSLEPTQRSSYGRLLVGAVKECRAVVDISYIVKPIPVI